MNPKAFLAVVGTVYYQPVNGQPSGVPRNFQIPIYTDQDPLIRRVPIGQEWQPLDKGWLSEVGFVEVFNEAGVGLAVHPSEEAKQNLSNQIVEVGGIVVRPGCAARFEPVDFASLKIRCRNGTVVCAVSLWPK